MDWPLLIVHKIRFVFGTNLCTSPLFRCPSLRSVLCSFLGTPPMMETEALMRGPGVAVEPAGRRVTALLRSKAVCSRREPVELRKLKLHILARIEKEEAVKAAFVGRVKMKQTSRILDPCCLCLFRDLFLFLYLYLYRVLFLSSSAFSRSYCCGASRAFLCRARTSPAAVSA